MWSIIASIKQDGFIIKDIISNLSESKLMESISCQLLSLLRDRESWKIPTWSLLSFHTVLDPSLLIRNNFNPVGKFIYTYTLYIHL